MSHFEQEQKRLFKIEDAIAELQSNMGITLKSNILLVPPNDSRLDDLEKSIISLLKDMKIVKRYIDEK